MYELLKMYKSLIPYDIFWDKTNLAGIIFRDDLDISKNYDIPDDVAEAYISIVDKCNDLFITDGGQPNYTNITEAKKLGITVKAGEQDSFGWLSGICLYDRHIIIFG